MYAVLICFIISFVLNIYGSCVFSERLYGCQGDAGVTTWLWSTPPGGITHINRVQVSSWFFLHLFPLNIILAVVFAIKALLMKVTHAVPGDAA